MTPADMARIHARAFTRERPWSETEFEQLCSSKFVELYATDAGFALVQVIQGEAELLTLSVHPDHHRQGIARALMLRWMRGVQADRAFLEVACDNRGAIALYAECGFTKIAERPQYYQGTDGLWVDAHVMSAPLTTGKPSISSE